MKQVRIAGIALATTGEPVILLKPIDELPGEGKLLPIWIGELEARAILIAIEGADVPRPLAHDLMRSLLESAEAEVTRVEVIRIHQGTFYAGITLQTVGGERLVDARPSDAVALAARVGAPIWVAESLLEQAGIPDIIVDPNISERLDEFKRFLDDVAPEDFLDPEGPTEGPDS